VFVMLARGQSNQVISDTLELNVKTISNYATTIKNKLKISSTAELVHLAIDAGVIKIAH